MKIKSVKTPIGNFNATYSKAGLTKFEYIKNQISPYPVDQDLQKSINIFFGQSKVTNLPILDLNGSEFQLKVWRALCEIPRGITESYKSLAKKIGSPRASRAVGTACKLNPIPLFIPCHRVVKHDGSIGEFALGTENKKFLLHMESL
jgi:O-6-methylguanine DNA methyltransferase